MTTRIRKSKSSPSTWKRHLEHYRRAAASKRAQPVAEVRVGADLRASWSARRADGSRALFCERHLTAQLDDIRDARPVKHGGLCSICSAPPVVTAHSVERWVERVDPTATPEQARLDMLVFLHSAEVAARPPIGIVSGHRALINPRRPGVLLIKRDVEPPVILTVLLADEVAA